MNFHVLRILFVTFFAISTISVQSKIDPRYLRGCYAGLKNPQFSVVHGVAALPKIQNQLLFNNETKVGFLVKQLLHQINNELVPPAALSRPASYLSCENIGLLVAAVHKNFPEELVNIIKTDITNGYVHAAQREQKTLKPKDQQQFNKELDKIFETLKKAVQAGSSYDVYATVLGLLYLKTGSALDLDQYYQGLAQGLGIQVGELFHEQNIIIDSNVYDQESITNSFAHLNQNTIDQNFVTTLAQNQTKFEEAIFSMLLINAGSKALPKEIDYRGGVCFQDKRYPDCFEAMIRNTLHAIMYDPQTQLCTLEQLKTYNIDPEQIDENIKNFFTTPLKTDKHVIEPWNPAQAGDKACHNTFSSIVCNRPWLTYLNQTDNKEGNFVRLAHGIDYSEFLKLAGEDKEKAITVLQADEPLCLYELNPTIKNFIILLDQLLNLKLFSTPEDALEKVFWNDDFEQIYLERLAQRLGWQHTVKNKESKKVLTIAKPGYYSFYIDFFRNHAEYHVVKDRQLAKLNNISLFETAAAEKLFFNASAGNVVGNDKAKKNIFKNYGQYTVAPDLLYFCDMSNPKNRSKIFELLAQNNAGSSTLKNFAKKLLLAPAPLDDYHYRSNIMKIFNQNIAFCKELALDDAVKLRILDIGIRSNDYKFFANFFNDELIERVKETQLIATVVKTCKQSLVEQLIQSLSSCEHIDTLFLQCFIRELLTQIKGKGQLDKVIKNLCNIMQKESTSQGPKIAFLEILAPYEQAHTVIEKTALQMWPLSQRSYQKIFNILKNNNYPLEKIFEATEKLFQSSDENEKSLALLHFQCFAGNDLQCPQAEQAAAQSGLENSIACEILKTLITRNQEIDKVIAIAQEGVKSENKQVAQKALELFDMMISKDFAFAQAAQAATQAIPMYASESYSYSYSYGKNYPYEILNFLLDKGQELDAVGKAIPLLCKHNEYDGYRILNKLFDKLNFEQTVAYMIQNSKICTHRESIYSKSRIDLLFEKTKQDINALQIIETKAFEALKSEGDTLLPGALIMFEKLIENNCAFETALTAVEKAIACSHQATQIQALNVLAQFYTVKDKDKQKDLLPRIAQIVKQNTEVLYQALCTEKNSLSYYFECLLEHLIENNLAIDTLFSLAKCLLHENKKVKLAFKLLRKLVSMGHYAAQALECAQQALQNQTPTKEMLYLFHEFTTKNFGWDEAEKLVTQKISTDQIDQFDIQSLSWIMKNLISKGRLVEPIKQFIVTKMIGQEEIDNNNQSNYIVVIRELVQTNKMTCEEVKKIANALNNESSNNKLLIYYLFDLLIDNSYDLDGAYGVAQHWLNDNKKTRCALDLLEKLVEKQYQPAYATALESAKKYITHKNWSESYRARHCFEKLIKQQYKLKEIRKFAATIDQASCNNECKELIKFLETAKKRKADVLEETNEANNENTDDAAGSKKQKLDDEAEEGNEAEGNIIIQEDVSMQDA